MVRDPPIGPTGATNTFFLQKNKVRMETGGGGVGDQWSGDILEGNTVYVEHIA